MKFFKGNIRIIPLLVLVSLLSFSVRLAELVTDASALSGSAYAEDVKKAAETPKETHKEAPKAAEAKLPELPAPEKTASVPPPAAPTVSAEGTGAVEVPQWRDPGDQDPNAKVVRREVNEELQARRQGLEEREKKLVAREALLKVAEQEIDQKYKEMTQLRKEIEELLGKQSEEEKARITSLVKVYEGMKPKDAARIFDTLDLDVLVSVMGQMSERKLSPVLAAMNAERAQTVTIMLAEQKKLPSLPGAPASGTE